MKRALVLSVVLALVLAPDIGAGWLEWAGLRRGSDEASQLIVTSGHVEATEHRLSFKVGGTVMKLGFEEGDQVKAGQRLAELDTTDTRLALAAARAERAQAAADLKLRLAGSRVEEIAQARAQVKKAQVELAGAERDFRRSSSLVSTGAETAKALDDARTRRDAAASGLDALREQLRKLEAGSRPEEIEAARARLAVADARIAQVEQQLSDATVVSPASGIVAEKLAEVGELAARGTPLAVLTDLSRPWLVIYVSEPDLDDVRVGQEVEVVTDGGHRGRGRVTFIAPQAEFTPKNVQTRDERVKLVFKLKVTLENADGLFKPGMPAEARIRRREAGK